MWHKSAQQHVWRCSSFSPELMPAVLVKLKAISQQSPPSRCDWFPSPIERCQYIPVTAAHSDWLIEPRFSASALRRSGYDVWRPAHTRVCVRSADTQPGWWAECWNLAASRVRIWRRMIVQRTPAGQLRARSQWWPLRSRRCFYNSWWWNQEV